MFFIIFIQSILFSIQSDPTGQSDKNIYFINNNPATINNNLVFGYIPNKFNLPELNDIYLYSNYRINDFILNANINSTNNELNTETKISLGTIYRYNNIFNFGIRFNYNNYAIKNYINSNYFNLDLGAIFYFDSIFSVGAYYNNIQLNNNIYYNPDYFKFAIAYNKNNFSMFIGADVLINNQSGIITGVKYNINENISFRVDYSTLIKSINSNISFKYNNFIFNLFLTHHNSLGYSQNYQINYDY